jgi:hypothetical protein
MINTAAFSREQMKPGSRAPLFFGILSSLIYVAMNVFVPFLWKEYSSVTQTVSELSAIDAPTRSIWLPFGVIYAVSFGIFGYGVLKVSRENRNVALLGKLVIIYSCFSIYWPPMHLRGVETGVTDTLHVVWTMITVLLMILIMTIGAITLGRSFKFYTIANAFLLIVFGIMTTLEAPNIASNLPTPTIGIWERLNIGVFMMWVVILSINLLKRERPR